jgi:IS5 family transposase
MTGFSKKSSGKSSPEPATLKAQLNAQHALFKLANLLDWESLEQEFGTTMTVDGGRPPLPVRLMVGLHYLKALYNESDESVVAKWVENPYWQYFCGEETFQHQLPCHPSSLGNWRRRVGVDGLEKLLSQVIKTAMQCEALSPKDVKQVIVDTTVQEKAIAFPTDARLYDKARRTLVRMARKHQVKLRQTYVRVGKQVLLKQSRYAATRQGRRAKKQTRILRTYLGRVIRDLERKLQPMPEAVAVLLKSAKRIYQQQKQDKGKCYSIHAPEVECIAKGKAQKPYEFGCKVVLTTTNASNWIVGIAAQHGNPYDGSTLTPAIQQVARLTGIRPNHATVDQGFRGKAHHPQDVEVLVCDTRNRTGKTRRLFKRRSAIEPVIGHSKSDHCLGRNYLKGQLGDSLNALLAGCGFNLRKLFRALMVLDVEPA